MAKKREKSVALALLALQMEEAGEVVEGVVEEDPFNPVSIIGRLSQRYCRM